MAVADYALAGGSGALSGAATGAAFGPAGIAVGAVVGGALGLFGQSQADKQAEEQRRLQQKQARRQKNLAAKQRSVDRRAVAQSKEAASRAAKEGRDIQPPILGGQSFALIQSMSLGSGSPFDSFIQRTYGRPQTSDPQV
jgi:phage tail tape-measure protein|tara:strand:+ start:15366 stop:15785 length:420 start_codon:yes stop_codon:yes gene_type:complete